MRQQLLPAEREAHGDTVLLSKTTVNVAVFEIVVTTTIAPGKLVRYIITTLSKNISPVSISVV